MSHVSCIIPAFNAERYLAAALQSVLAQTIVPEEIVVVDDGSSDATASVAAGFGPRVRLLRQANAGPAAARNTGVRATSGSMITFLDADDLWEPAKVAMQLELLARRPELAFCVTMLRNFVSEELAERRVRDERLLEPMAGFSFVTLMVRRGALEEIGFFDESRLHSDDTEWLMRAGAAGALHGVVPHVLARRRLHESNMSQTAGAQSRQEYVHLIKDMLDRRRGRVRAGN